MEIPNKLLTVNALITACFTNAVEIVAELILVLCAKILDAKIVLNEDASVVFARVDCVNVDSSWKSFKGV
jgi:hypothetical protein